MMVWTEASMHGRPQLTYAHTGNQRPLHRLAPILSCSTPTLYAGVHTALFHEAFETSPQATFLVVWIDARLKTRFNSSWCASVNVCLLKFSSTARRCVCLFLTKG